MSDIARNIYSSARRDREADAPTVACTYTNAINSVRRASSIILKESLPNLVWIQIQLSQTFLGLAESMRQTRSSLIRS